MVRLDSELVARGMVPTRTRAQRLITEGMVLVAGRVVQKPSHAIEPADEITLVATDNDVSRGAKKLRSALDKWNLPVANAHCVDLGASTGGFTQVLLERGAQSVVAIDVGHGQFDARLGSDSRVSSFEGINVTGITAEWWESHSRGTPTVVVADLSFISLVKVIPAIVALWGVHSHYVVLVKPQFEVGRAGLVGGIVKDENRRHTALRGVADAFRSAGVPVRGVMLSPITGEKGNLEYLLYASATTTSHPTEWDGLIPSPRTSGSLK